MFNGMMKSDDVEVYEFGTSDVSSATLLDNCKSNIMCIFSGNAGNASINLPTVSYIGKVINFTLIVGINGTGKTAYSALSVFIRHSNANLFTLKQGTVSFMYVGQQLNGLTATDKAKAGWMILGGVQGDTAITGHTGSVAIGNGAYASGASGTAIGQGATASANSTANGVSSSATSSSVAEGLYANASGLYSIAIGSYTVASGVRSICLGDQAGATVSKMSFKTNAVFSGQSDAQAGKFILMRQTTDATPLVLSATNAAASTSNILILPNNGTYAFKGTVVAKDATTLDSAMWEVTALMKRGANASLTTVVGSTVTKVFADTAAAAWTIALTADTTNGGGTITVTGEAAKTIRWVSNIDSAEVI